MAETDPRELEKVAKRMLAELARQEPPTEEELERYDYMKKDFVAAIAAAGAELRRADDTAPEGGNAAVFSLAGRLVAWAEDVIVRTLRPGGHLQPVAVGARGVARGVARGEERRRQPVARIRKKQGGVLIEVATYRAGEATEIEFDLLDVAGETQVRPFDVTVLDTRGGRVAGPLTVRMLDGAARFPGPSPGVYVFVVSWEGRSAEVRIEFAHGG